ncbi:MAG: hypothetical protein Q8Q12_00840 [bacterium]|nr:hypothetical protein [bacterium]
MSFMKKEKNMRGNRNKQRQQGTALPICLILTACMAIGAAAFLNLSSTEVVQVRRNLASTRAFYYAETGITYAQMQLLRGWRLSKFTAPFHFLDYGTITTLPAEKVVQAGTPEEGRFYAEILEVTTPYHDGRDVTVRSTGTYRGEKRSILTTFCLELAPSKVFDYVYFLNHWGWTEGIPSAFQMNGNVRANGHFSFSNSSLYLNGTPESTFFRGQTVYKDSGGIYSGYTITGAPSLHGMGALAVNQHMNEDTNENGALDAGEDHDQDGRLTRPEHVEMPNLTEMALYEEYALGWRGGTGSSIKIQGAGENGTDLVVCDAVYGDETGEKGNLLLWGTQQNPIVIDGPVVARGAVIIKGYVKGKGSLYVQGNVYVPDNLMYVDPPVGKPDWDYFDYGTPEERYQSWQQAATAWREANAEKDGLGLFARENIIIGDFTDATWKGTVQSWLNNSANESAERANGLDHMPNTSDSGEGDSTWTVDSYTQEDLEAGLIPPGKGVGDVVPGSGEDIDGDGVTDGRIGTNDFSLPAALKTQYWGGWTPPEIVWPLSGINYGQFLNQAGAFCLNHIDALMYTNHATAGAWGKNSPGTHILGGIVSRVEAIVLYTGSADWTHDERFTGGGEEFGFLLPRVKSPIAIVHWREVPVSYEE